MFDSAKYQKTWADIKQFASTKFDLFKVGFLEKAAKIVGLILFALVLILLLFAVISFGCLALIYAIGQALPMWASALIVVVLWLLLMIGVVVFRDQLFINPMLAAISSILFEQPADSSQPANSNSAVPAEKEVRNE